MCPDCAILHSTVNRFLLCAVLDCVLISLDCVQVALCCTYVCKGQAVLYLNVQKLRCSVLDFVQVAMCFFYV